jgi:hypothetical protein
VRRLYQRGLLYEARAVASGHLRVRERRWTRQRSVLDPLAQDTGKAVRSILRCLESACTIAASAPAVAGVPRWLRAYRGRTSARSCCRAEPLIPAHHCIRQRFVPLTPGDPQGLPDRVWPHSAGSTASSRYYADDRLRRNGIGAASGSPIIVDLAGAQPALSRMLRGGYNKMRCGSRDDIH